MAHHERPALPPASRLLDGPAARSARLLCREFARDAGTAVAALALEGDAVVEGRHDLRVALRQLRVTLDAYAPVLDDTVPRKLSRRARALGRRLSAARDRDVQRVLLHSVAAARTASQRTALNRLARTWTQAADIDTAAVAGITRDWQRLAAPLDESLSSWQETQQLDAPPAATPFGLVAADALDRAARKLARRCARIMTPGDMAEMHAARLSVKTVRYILKPLVGDDADARIMLQSLRAAQDLLGGIHDAHALREALREAMRDAPTGQASRATGVIGAALEASDRELAHRIAAGFDQLAGWRTAAALAIQLQRLQTIAESWRQRAITPMEYERKWVLSALPPRVREVTPATLRQGYLPGDALVERIRSVTRAGTTHWVRTVKLGRGVARIEVEEAATAALGKALFALTKGRRVEKKRYAVSDGALTWEIDDFTDRTLVLAEVEFPDAATSAEFPPWLAPYVVREVTDDVAFTNWKLAR